MLFVIMDRLIALGWRCQSLDFTSMAFGYYVNLLTMQTQITMTKVSISLFFILRIS